MGVQELGNNDHGSRWTDIVKDLAVDAANGFPVGGVGEVHAGANYVRERRAGAGEDFGND